MATIILTLGGVSALCAAGFGLSTGLRWFHSYEIDFSDKKSKKERPTRGGVADDRIDHIRKEVRQRS